MLNCALLKWSVTLLMMNEVPSRIGASFDTARGLVTKDDGTGHEDAGAKGACGVLVLTCFLTHQDVQWQTLGEVAHRIVGGSHGLNAQLDDNKISHHSSANALIPGW
jgi:hypothetical protein